MHTYTTVSGVRIAFVAILVFLSSFVSPQGAITGHVLDDKNEPLNNATIKVYVDGVLQGCDETDCDGNYEVKPLAAGNYDMVVVYPGYDSIMARSVVVVSGNATTLNFQMLKLKHHSLPQTLQNIKGKPIAKIIQGEINGRILDEKKEPFINAAIQVIQNGTLKGGNVSDYDGYYAIKPLDPGDYDMHILAMSYDSMNAKSVVVASGATTTINFQMKRSPFRLQEYRPVCGGGLSGGLVRISHSVSTAQDKIDLIPVVMHKSTVRDHKQTPIPQEYVQFRSECNLHVFDMDAPTKRTYSREEISHMPL